MSTDPPLEPFVPVTATLSRRFYEIFGDETVNELVEWFNAVDATYRADLRELNELNFARFDAKVEQRFAESETRWERRFSTYQGRIEQRFSALQAHLEQRFADLQTRMARGHTKVILWSFAFWLGTVGVLFLDRFFPARN